MRVEVCGSMLFMQEEKGREGADADHTATMLNLSSGPAWHVLTSLTVFWNHYWA